MPPELRRLLRWAIPLLGILILANQTWNTWNFSVTDAGESCAATACRLRLVWRYSAAYGLLLPAWLWLSRPRSGLLLLAALAGIIGSARWAAYGIEHGDDHSMLDVRGWAYLTLALMLPVLIWLLVRRLKTRKAAA